MAGQESGGVVSVSAGTEKRKEEVLKIAAKEYEKLGLLDYSMDEEGSKSAGEEDESLLNVEDGQEMDVDNPGAAAGGGKQDGETGQGGKEKPVVPLTAEEKLERELRRKKRVEKKEGGDGEEADPVGESKGS